jgi:hypothetical protein
LDKSNDESSESNNRSSFDSFFDVSPELYQRNHHTEYVTESSEDDEMPPLEEQKFTEEEPNLDSESDTEGMPPLMPKRRIAHVA